VTSGDSLVIHTDLQSDGKLVPVKQITSLVTWKDFILVGLDNGQVRWLDSSGNVVKDLFQATLAVKAIKVNPRGDWVAFCGEYVFAGTVLLSRHNSYLDKAIWWRANN
jgi:hypothetical protein